MLAASLPELRHNGAGNNGMCGVSCLDKGKLTLSQRKQTVEEASTEKKREDKERKFCGREVLPENEIRTQHLLPKPNLSTENQTVVLSLLCLQVLLQDPELPDEQHTLLLAQ